MRNKANRLRLINRRGEIGFNPELKIGKNAEMSGDYADYPSECGNANTLSGEQLCAAEVSYLAC